MRRLILILGSTALLLVLLAWGIGSSATFRHWVERRAEMAIEARTGRPAEIQLAAIHPARLRVEIARLRLVAQEPAHPDALQIEGAVLDLRWRSLVKRRLDASELVIRRLRLDLDEWARHEAEEATDSPIDLGAVLRTIAIDRLELHDGILDFDDRSSRFGLALEGIELVASYREGAPAYRSTVNVRGGDVRVPGRAPLPIDLNAKLLLQPHELEVENLRLHVAGAEVSGKLALTFGQSLGYRSELLAVVPIRELLDDFEANSGAGGALTLSGTVVGEGEHPLATFALGHRDLHWNGVQVEELTGILVADASHARLDGLRLELPGAILSGQVASRSEAAWLPIDADLAIEASDLRPLCDALSVQHQGACPAGALGGSWTGTLNEASLEGLSGSVDLAAEALRFTAGPSWQLSARALHDGRDLSIDSLHLASRAATFDTAGTLRPSDGLTLESRVRLAPIGEALLDLAALARAFGWDAQAEEALMRRSPTELARLAGTLEGRVTLSGPPSMHWEAFRGRADLAIEGGTTAETRSAPIDGAIVAVLEGGAAELLELDLEGGGATFRAEGRISAGGARDVSAEIDIAEVGATAQVVRTLLAEVGTGTGPFTSEVEWGGAVHGRLRLNGPWRSLDGEGVLEIGELSVGRHALGRSSAEVTLVEGRLQADAELTGPSGSRLDLSVRSALPFDSGTLSVTAHRQALAPLLALAGLELEVEGALEGAATVEWPGRRAEGRISLIEARASGLPIEELKLAATLSDRGLRVTEGKLAAAGGLASMQGSVGPDLEELEVRGSGFELAQIARAFAVGLDLAGRVDFAGKVRGGLDAPRFEGTVEIAGAHMLDRPAPSLSGLLTADSAAIHLDLEGVEEGSPVHLVLDLGLLAGPTWNLELRYPLHLDLGTWLATQGVSHDLTASGTLDASLGGSSDATASLSGSVRLEDVSIEAGDVLLRAREPIEIQLEGRTLRWAETRLEGRETELVLSGSAGLEPGAPLEVAAEGHLDLGLLTGWDQRLRSTGTAALTLAVGGTSDAPTWEGTVEIRDGALAHPEWPLSFAQSQAKLELDGREWRLVELSALAGGGQIEGTGSAVLSGGALEEYRLELHGNRVRLAYPEGFRSELDTNLVLMKRAGALSLSGEIELRRGIYETDFEIERQILRRVRDFSAPTVTESSWLDRLQLDLDAQADGGLFLRNDFANLESRGDLSFAGTLRHPLVTGRIDALQGGTVTFRRIVYQVTRGSISYLGTQEALLDVEGETTVGAYDVILTASGPLSAPTFELRSDPPLPRSDIVTLLVTGRTRDELAQGGGGLSEAEAATYLTSRLGEAILPELRRSLGLDELRVDPVLVADQANPAARVTVGKSLSNRASATYSREFGSGGSDIYQLRYRLSDHWSVQGTRDDDGSVAGDVRFRTRRYTQGGAQGDEPQGTADGLQIVAVEITGDATAPEKRLHKLLGVAPGQRHRRSQLLDGIDAIERWYVGRGYPEVEIDSQVSQEGRGVRIRLQIRKGQRLIVEVRGFDRQEAIEDEVLSAWQQAVFRDEALDQIRRVAEQYLASRGYAFATVVADLTPAGPDEIRVLLDVEPGSRVRVASIDVRGNEAVSGERIRDQMLTEPYRRFDHSYWREELLEEDLAAIQALYQSEGFLAAEIVHRIEVAPGESEVRIHLEVAEGPRYRIRRLEFSGNAALPDEELTAVASLAPGATFDPAAQVAAERRLQATYDERGYPDAVVASTADLDPASAKVDLHFEITEGRLQTIAEVEIEGLVKTRENVVRRELALEVGDPASVEKLARARYNLYRTGLFRSVDYEVLPADEEGRQRVVFRLEEAPDLRLDYSVGADTQEGARIGGEIAQVNLFGRRLYGAVGGRYSDRDQRAHVLLRAPRLGRFRAAGLATLFWEDELRESYRAQRLGLGLRASRTWHEKRSALDWGYDFEDVRLVEDDFLSGSTGVVETISDLRLASLSAGLSHDARDAPFWPTSGWFGRAELRAFDEALLSEAEFVRAFGQWNLYRPVLGRAVWALGVRLGAAEPYGSSTDLPVSERYFLGGDSSLRGFALDSVVPVAFPGDVDTARGVEESPGGNALFAVNQELLFPVWAPVYGVLFYDAGNLYWELSDLDPTDLRHAVGLGARIQTPVGPLRLEYGWKLDRRDGESPGQFHFSIGVPF